MKGEIFSMLSEVNSMYREFIYEMERRIKRIIFPFTDDELPNSKEILNVREELNEIVNLAQQREDKKTDYLLRLEMKGKLNANNEKHRFLEYMQLDRETFRKIREIFRNVVLCAKNLEEKEAKLNAFWVDRIKKEIEETMKYMDDFYNSEYQEIKKMNQEVIEKMNAIKR